MQYLVMCNHPKLWLLLKGLEKDSQKKKTAFLQGFTVIEEIIVKTYCNLIGQIRWVSMGEVGGRCPLCRPLAAPLIERVKLAVGVTTEQMFLCIS